MRKPRKHPRLFAARLAALAAALPLLAGTAVAAPATQDKDVRDVAWRNATFTVPEIGPCPWQTVPFHDGSATLPDHVYRFTPNQPVRYADVTGEGRLDALMLIDCGPPNSEFTTALVAMTTDQRGNPRPVNTVLNPKVWTTAPVDFTNWYGDIAVLVRDSSDPTDPVVHTEYYRWAASAKAFVRVDGG